MDVDVICSQQHIRTAHTQSAAREQSSNKKAPPRENRKLSPVINHCLRANYVP